RAWNEPLQVLLQAGNVALDVEIETDDLFAIRTEHEDVGLADRLAEQVDAPGGARHGVGDGGVCDQYVVGVGWQVHDHRLVEAELDALAGGRRAYRGLAACICSIGAGHGRPGEQEAHSGQGDPHSSVQAHFLAPTSETSPDLMRRIVPLRPLPATR